MGEDNLNIFKDDFEITFDDVKVDDDVLDSLVDDYKIVEGIKIDPLDYIMSRIWDSGKFKNMRWLENGEYLESPAITFDDLEEELGKILCFDNLE